MHADDILDAPPIADVKQPLTYSKFWHRVLASIIDGMIVSGFNLIVKLVLIRWVSYAADLIFVNVTALAFGIFFHVFLVARFGVTPGKMILRMRIVQRDGTPAIWGNAILRYMVTFACSSALTIPYLIAYAYPAVNPDEWDGYFIQLFDRQLSLPIIALYLWNIISVIVVASNKQRRAPHDFIAGTVVIRKR